MGVVSLLFMGSVLIDSDLFPEIESLFIYDDALEARSRSTGHEHRHTIVPNTTQANDSTISEHGTLKNEVDTLTITGAEHLSCGIGPYIKTVILGKKDIRRWCLCAHALVRLEAPLQTSFENTATHKLSRNCDGSISTESTSERIIGQYWLMNHPFAIWFLFGESGQKNLIVVLFLPIIYGGMHLSAINTATFPSSIEAILWYISAGGVAAVPWIYLVLIMVMMAMDDVNQSLIVAILDTLHVTINNIAWLGAIISQLFRRYMFVESFISLRNVSLGVYAEIPWLQAIPHI